MSDNRRRIRLSVNLDISKVSEGLNKAVGQIRSYSGRVQRELKAIPAAFGGSAKPTRAPGGQFESVSRLRKQIALLSKEVRGSQMGQAIGYVSNQAKSFASRIGRELKQIPAAFGGTAKPSRGPGGQFEPVSQFRKQIARISRETRKFANDLKESPAGRAVGVLALKAKDIASRFKRELKQIPAAFGGTADPARGPRGRFEPVSQFRKQIARISRETRKFANDLKGSPAARAIGVLSVRAGDIASRIKRELKQIPAAFGGTADPVRGPRGRFEPVSRLRKEIARISKETRESNIGRVFGVLGAQASSAFARIKREVKQLPAAFGGTADPVRGPRGRFEPVSRIRSTVAKASRVTKNFSDKVKAAVERARREVKQLPAAFGGTADPVRGPRGQFEPVSRIRKTVAQASSITRRFSDQVKSAVSRARREIKQLPAAFGGTALPVRGPRGQMEAASGLRKGIAKASRAIQEFNAKSKEVARAGYDSVVNVAKATAEGAKKVSTSTVNGIKTLFGKLKNFVKDPLDIKLNVTSNNRVIPRPTSQSPGRFLTREEQFVERQRRVRGTGGYGRFGTTATRAYFRIVSNLRREFAQVSQATRRFVFGIRTLSRNFRRGLAPINMTRQAIRGLIAPIRLVNSAIRRSRKAFDAFGNIARNLSSARFMIASAAAAFGGVQFAKLAGEVSNAEVSFRSIVRTLGSDPEKALKGFRESLKRTASDVEIFRQVSTAAIFDIASTSLDLQKIFRTARRLGRATGRTTGDAIRDISLGIGRQSRLILDNIGLIVRVQRANEVYADSVGKTVEQLTDLEKKFAFQRAALRAADVAVARLGEDYDTFNDILLEFRSNLANTGKEAAKSLTPVLSKILKAFNKIDFDKVGQSLSMIAAGGLSRISEVVGSLTDKFESLIEAFGEFAFKISAGGVQILEGILDRIERIFKNPGKELAALYGDVAGFVGTFIGEILKTVFNVENLKAITVFIKDLLLEVFSSLLASIGSALEASGTFLLRGLGEGLSYAAKSILPTKEFEDKGSAWMNVLSSGLRILGSDIDEIQEKSQKLFDEYKKGLDRDEDAKKQRKAELEAANTLQKAFTQTLGTDDPTIENVLKAVEAMETDLTSISDAYSRRISAASVTLDNELLKEEATKLNELTDSLRNAENEIIKFDRAISGEGKERDLELLFRQNKIDESLFGKDGIFSIDLLTRKSAIESVRKTLKDNVLDVLGQIQDKIVDIDKLYASLSGGGTQDTPMGENLRFRALAGVASLASGEAERIRSEDVVKAKSNETKLTNLSVALNKELQGLRARILTNDENSLSILESTINQKKKEAEIELNRLGITSAQFALTRNDFLDRTERQQRLLAGEKLLNTLSREANSLREKSVQTDLEIDHVFSSQFDKAMALNAAEEKRLQAEIIRLGLLGEETKKLEEQLEITQKLKRDAIEQQEELRITQGFKSLYDNLTGGISSAIVAGVEASKDGWRKFAQSLGGALRSNIDTALQGTIDNLMKDMTSGISEMVKKLGVASSDMLLKMSQAIVGIIGLILSAQKDSTVTELSEDAIQASSSAVRGVIAGPQNVAIAEIGDSIAEANRGTESLLSDILDVLEDIRGNNLTSGGIGAAGTI